MFDETWETNGSLPEPVEACRNCHVHQARLMGAVGGCVADALTPERFCEFQMINLGILWSEDEYLLNCS